MSYNVGHPLKSPALPTDAGITRPHLSRLTQDTPSESSSSSSDNDESHNLRPKPSRDQEVIVHKVTSQDSLPGVSLKYGIPLAELRQFNQLWTSDSIHLRNVLYIPVQRATRAHLSYRADTAVRDADIPSSPIIQRIPISQLSFFPPRIQPRMTRRRSLTEHSVPSTSLPRSFARTQSFQPTAPTSFTAVASYRDDIIPRLSLDSIGPTSGPKHSRRFDTGENHELETVKTASNLVPKFRFSFEDRLMVKSSGLDHELRTPRVNVPYRDDTEHIRRVPPSSPPSFYIPPSSSLSIVRTVQMEPSPIMQIPKMKRNFLHSNHSRSGTARDRDASAGKPQSSAHAMELQDTSKPLSG